MKVGKDVQKYLLVLLIFAILSCSVFLVTLTFNVRFLEYFGPSAYYSTFYTAEQEGELVFYKEISASAFTQKEPITQDDYKFYSQIKFVGAVGASDKILKLRRMNFSLSAKQDVRLNIEVLAFDSSGQVYYNSFAVILQANKQANIPLDFIAAFSGIPTTTAVEINISQNTEQSDPVPFAIYNISFRK